MNDNIVFLDFDGVLYNTVKEAYAVATITYGKYSSIEEIDYSNNHYKDFYKLRYLVGPAWNYKYILELMDTAIDMKDFERKYKLLINDVDVDDYNGFEETFFINRNKIKKIDFDKWFRLNEPYTFLNGIKKYLLNMQDKFFIVTTKDKETVLRLLEIENISFTSDRVYDKEDFQYHGSKSKIIESIITRENIKKAIFIDDSAHHLQSCVNIPNLLLLQASWGYTSENDKNTSTENQIISEIEKLIGH